MGALSLCEQVYLENKTKHFPAIFLNLQTTNVVVSFDEGHFKRMGTLIAMLGVDQTGEEFHIVRLKPAVLLESKKPKVIKNPNNLLCTMKPMSKLAIQAQYKRNTVQ